MLRIFFKKWSSKYQRKKLIKTYKKLIIFLHDNTHSFSKQLSFFNNLFFTSLPARQQFFFIFNMKKKKQFNYSSGILLKQPNKNMKFFKRNIKNITALVLYLKRYLLSSVQHIYMYYVKNFNKRQLLFFKKLHSLIKPDIQFFIFKRSFMPRFLPKRRIRRKVLRLLLRG